MFVTQLKMAAGLLAASVLLTATGGLAYRTLAGDQPSGEQKDSAKPPDTNPKRLRGSQRNSPTETTGSEAREIQQLILQLGSSKFTEREAASRRLKAKGQPALESLRHAAKASDDPEIRRRSQEIVQAIEHRVYGPSRLFEGHTEGILCIVISPDGRRALSSSFDRTVRLWDMQSGKEIRRLQGHADRVDGVSFSSDGRRALSASWDGTTRLWDLETGKELKLYECPGRQPGVHMMGAVFLPDGKQFLWWACDHHNLHVYDLENGKLLKEFAPHDGHLGTVTLSADGRRVLEGSGDVRGPLRLWDLGSGMKLRQFQGDWSSVSSVAFSPDGRQALSATSEKTAALWDVESGKLLRRFKGHADGISAVAFSPDGRRALGASSDYTISLWDLATGKELHYCLGHTNVVTRVAFSPDGRYALSGGYDKILRLWRLPE